MKATYWQKLLKFHLRYFLLVFIRNFKLSQLLSICESLTLLLCKSEKSKANGIGADEIMAPGLDYALPR
jgi:hypothetical protein